MEQIPTAEEFFEQGGTYPELAIKFAKLHVEAALKAATDSLKAKLKEGIEAKESHTVLVGKTILSAYPLENIK